MSLQKLSRAYGTQYAGLNAGLRDSAGTPARLYGLQTGEIPTPNGAVVLDASGGFSTFVDDSRTYKLEIYGPAGSVVLTDFGIEADTSASEESSEPLLEERSIHVSKFWAVPSPPDEGPAITAAMLASRGKELYFHNATHRVQTPIQILQGGFKFIGAMGAHSPAFGPSQSGTTILFDPATRSDLFTIGTDDGVAWDSPTNYNGPQGTHFINLNLMMNSPLRTTSIAGGGTATGGGTYAGSCSGIKDWRGGHVLVSGCWIEGFENSFWGIKSDFDHFIDVMSTYSKNGIYLGPRSDQCIIDGLYTWGSVSAAVVDGASGVTFNQPRLVATGSSTVGAIDIRQGSVNVTINDPWYENNTTTGVPNALGMVTAGVFAGYASTTEVQGVTITTPTIAVSPSSARTLVQVGKARRVVLNDLAVTSGTSQYTNLTSLIEYAAGFDHSTNNSSVFLYLKENFSDAKYFTNFSTGSTPAIYVNQRAAAYTKESNILGRFAICKVNGSAGSDMLAIGQEGGSGQVLMWTPNYSTGQINRFRLTRSFQQLAAMPTSGTWEIGDYVVNSAPAELGTTGSKYVIRGWSRVTTGANHVLNTDWLQDRGLTGN